MTYDQWKTRSTDDELRDADGYPTEDESCPGGLSTETLREYLRTHPAARLAADALHTDRLDDPKF